MSHPLGDASWIAQASSGLLPDLGSAERCGRWHVRLDQHLKPMRVELEESNQSVQRQPWVRRAAKGDPVRAYLIGLVARVAAPNRAPLLWRPCHSHSDCPQLAVGQLSRAKTPAERSGKM